MSTVLFRNESRRVGATLGEVLLAMVLGSMLLGLSTRLIHRAFENESGSLASVRFQNMSLRVAHQFRRDTAAAKSCDMEGAELKLVQGDSTVIYEAQENVLHRTEVRNGELSAHHTDDFVLPKVCAFSVGWEAVGVNQDAGLAKITIIINDSLESPQASPEAIEPRTIVLEGAVFRPVRRRGE